MPEPDDFGDGPPPRGPLPGRASSGGGAAQPPALLRLMFALTLFALLLLTISTFLLWQVADHTKQNRAPAAQAPLPPPSEPGGGRALLKEIDRTNRATEALLAEFRRANLGALTPSIAQL